MQRTRHPRARARTPGPCRAAVRLALLVLLLAAAACSARPGRGTDAGAPPLHLTAQRVLVLPVQPRGALPVDPATLDAEILFALQERDPRVVWVGPTELRQALRRSPGIATDPAALPADPLLHHGERRAVEPLAGVVRRYSALTDARLVLIPHLAAAPGTAASAAGVRLGGSLLDARTGHVVWWGDVMAPLAATPDRAALAEAARAFAERLLATRAAEAAR